METGTAMAAGDPCAELHKWRGELIRSEMLQTMTVKVFVRIADK
jgi:hypothetical protein